MARKAKPLPPPTKPRKHTVFSLSALPKSPEQKTKPRQKRKPKQVKTDKVVKVLDYFGNYLLLLGVSAVIVGLSYWFKDAFE